MGDKAAEDTNDEDALGVVLVGKEAKDANDKADPYSYDEVTMNKDFYGLAVLWHLQRRPKWMVAITICIALFLFVVEFTIIRTIIEPHLYMTVNTSNTFMWLMKLGFMILNWTSFQLPYLLHAHRLYMVNSRLAEFFATLQILALFPMAYFSAALILVNETPIGVIFSYLKLAIITSLNEKCLSAIYLLVNYYMGDGYVGEHLDFTLKVRKGTSMRYVFHRIKLVWPVLLLGTSFFRWFETTGPVVFAFPQPQGAHHYYEHFYDAMGSSLEYTPKKDYDVAKQCDKIHSSSGVPMEPVTNAAFIDAARRKHPHLSQSNIMCQAKYMLVPEPWVVEGMYNYITHYWWMWTRSLIFQPITAGAGTVPKKYIKEGEPGNRHGDDELKLGFCGVCENNGMTCIPSDHEDCDIAAAYLGVETVDTSTEYPLSLADYFDNIAQNVDDLEHYEHYLKPLLATMKRTSCRASPTGFKAVQFFVKWHICELPKA